jgi:hypothetical protein
MKIKLKKQLNENAYMKLSIKIDDYTLHDKFTKQEIEDIIETLLHPTHQIVDFTKLGEEDLCTPGGTKKC